MHRRKCIISEYMKNEQNSLEIKYFKKTQKRYIE